MQLLHMWHKKLMLGRFRMLRSKCLLDTFGWLQNFTESYYT